MLEQELYQIPLIDTHVHRVHPDRAPQWGNLGGGYIQGPGQEAFGRQTILYGMVMEALRKKFEMDENASMEQIEQERFRRYQVDPQKYYTWLLSHRESGNHAPVVGGC